MDIRVEGNTLVASHGGETKTFNIPATAKMGAGEVEAIDLSSFDFATIIRLAVQVVAAFVPAIADKATLIGDTIIAVLKAFGLGK